ncbi:hypothetical protein EB008_01040 [bacterium]|nr:hypothetical protein [bacterium]
MTTSPTGAAVSSELSLLIDSVETKLPSLGSSASPLPLRRSGLGASGVTFLPLTREIDFVIKFQSCVQTETEALATNVFRNIFPQFSVPPVYPKTDLLHRHRATLCPIMSKVEIDKKNPASESVLFMGYKSGSNLKYLTEGGQIFRLPASQFIYLFESIGQIAGADLLIGNCDRFVLKNFKGEIDETHRINSGNIMLEFPAEELGTAFQRIKRIHVIDNGPALISFFDKSENSGLAARAKGLGKELQAQREEDFSFYLNASDAQMDAIAHQIYLGFINSSWDAVNTPSESSVPLFKTKEELEGFFGGIPGLTNAIKQGLLRTREGLQTEELAKKIERVLASSSQTKAGTKKYIDFIQTNVNLAQGAQP